MKQIIIGKEGNQPFSIGDPKVSRQHAILNIDEASRRMLLIDNNSTNGTYIYNGGSFVRLYANQPCPVTPDTMIQLGTETRFHVRRLLQQPPTPVKPEKEKPKPKKVDIKELRRVSEHYHNEKMRLDAKDKSVSGLSSATMIVGSLVAVCSAVIPQIVETDNEQTKLFSTVIGFIFAIIFFITLRVYIGKQQKKIIRQRNKNEHDYAVKYCCPVCHASFKGKVYENILAEGRCPKCKAEYYESK